MTNIDNVDNLNIIMNIIKMVKRISSTVTISSTVLLQIIK